MKGGQTVATVGYRAAASAHWSRHVRKREAHGSDGDRHRDAEVAVLPSLGKKFRSKNLVENVLHSHFRRARD